MSGEAIDEGARRAEADGLDAAFLALVVDYEAGATIDPARVDALFLRTARHQARYNPAYRRYARGLGRDPETLDDPRGIAPVPAVAFKELRVATFAPESEALAFHTSGTSIGARGVHVMETAALYRAAARAAFRRLVLAPRGLEVGDCRILSLAPDGRSHPHSSLGFMVDDLMRLCNDGELANFIAGEDLRRAAFAAAVDDARRVGRPVCVFGTALALRRLIDESEAARLPLPPGSFVIETGGFKGRTTEFTRADLYVAAARFFAIDEDDVRAELGMTELSSQYYDGGARSGEGERVKVGPPWLRTLFLDAAGLPVADGAVGRIAHLDLANRGSAVAILTEDAGYRAGAGFVFLGRIEHAEPRGCSLTVDDTPGAARA